MRRVIYKVKPVKRFTLKTNDFILRLFVECRHMPTPFLCVPGRLRKSSHHPFERVFAGGNLAQTARHSSGVTTTQQ